MAPSATSSTSREEHPTASPGSLFQYLTTVDENKFLPMSDPSRPVTLHHTPPAPAFPCRARDGGGAAAPGPARSPAPCASPARRCWRPARRRAGRRWRPAPGGTAAGGSAAAASGRSRRAPPFSRRPRDCRWGGRGTRPAPVPARASGGGGTRGHGAAPSAG